MKILILGGGIGGLATAAALQQQGLDYELFESAPALHPVGAGIWMAPNAMSVLERLGLAETVKARGRRLKAGNITDARGKLLSRMDSDRIEARFGQPLVAMHRARLHETLLEAVDPARVHLGKRCKGVRQDATGVTAEFEDGSTAQGDVALGADGIHSAVRRSLFGDIPLRYSGQTCWRGIAPLQLGKFHTEQGFEMWGTRAGLRIGFSQLTGGDVYWYLTIAAPAADKRIAQGKSALLELVREFGRPATDILEAMPENAILRTDLFDFKPIASWHKGRVALLGDAAHATTPNLGQGGSQAIEDAWVIADCLARHTEPEAAFAAYQAIRMKKARQVVDTSFQIARLSNLGGRFATGLRNMLLRATPQRVAERRTDALYALNF